MEYPQARTEYPLFQVGRNVYAIKKQEQPQRLRWPTGMLTLICTGTTSSQAGSTALRMGYCSRFAHFFSRFHPLCLTLLWFFACRSKSWLRSVPRCHWHSIRYMSYIYLDCVYVERGFLKVLVQWLQPNIWPVVHLPSKIPGSPAFF